MRVLSSIVLAVLGLAADQRPTADVRTGPIRYAVVVGSLDDEKIVRETRALLGAQQVRLGRMVFYASPRQAVLESRSTYFEGCGPDELLGFLNSNGFAVKPGECLEFTEAIKIGSSIVLRKIETDCQVRTKLIAGRTNPLRVSSMGTVDSIVALSLHSGADKLPYAEVFVRTAAQPTTNLAKSILNQIKTVTAAPEIGVFVRKDGNFASHCSFPVPVLFQTGGLRTRGGALESDGEAVCMALAPHPVKCWTYGKNRKSGVAAVGGMPTVR